MASVLQGTFDVYQNQLTETISYLTAVAPYVVKEGKGLGVYSDASVVMMSAYHEHFLRRLVGEATRYRTAAIRAYLSVGKKPDETDTIMSCDLPALVRLVQRRVSFKEKAKRIDALFRALFGLSPWPTESDHEIIVNLVLVRNLIVHHAGAETAAPGTGPGEYARQITFDVLDVEYDGMVARVNHHKALKLLHRAMQTFSNQINHLRRELSDDQWITAR